MTELDPTELVQISGGLSPFRPLPVVEPVPLPDVIQPTICPPPPPQTVTP